METIISLLAEPEAVDLEQVRDAVRRVEGSAVAETVWDANPGHAARRSFEWRRKPFVFVHGAFTFDIHRCDSLRLASESRPPAIQRALDEHAAWSYVDEHFTLDSPFDVVCEFAYELRTGKELLLIRYGTNERPHQAVVPDEHVWRSLRDGHWPEGEAACLQSTPWPDAAGQPLI